MSLLKEILSSLDTSAPATPSAPSPVSRLASGSPKPVPRPAGPQNRASEPPVLKRKASGPVDSAQPKIQRKDAPARPGQTNGAPRAAPAPASAAGAAKSAPSPSATTVPYRGTAGLGASRPVNAPAKKLASLAATQPKASVAAPKLSAVAKSVAASPASGTAAPAKKPGAYMAMLQKAKEKDQTKAAAPPVKNESAKIMTKKDRELARMQAKAAAKGKKPVTGVPAKVAGVKADAAKDKRKAPELGYQGTARPTKKAADIGYKGTARPNAVGASSGRPGLAAKPKPKPSQSRYGGYANWSDVEEEDAEEEDEEDDYASDVSSDMEAAPWEVDEEETMALKAARKEDAEALAEETRLKLEKEERKRKLMALNKAAASKRKY